MPAQSSEGDERPGELVERSRAVSGRRRPKRGTLALVIALAADVAQWVLLPLVLGGGLSPVNNVIDVGVAIAMLVLVGWHWAFLPTFIAELIPVVDLVPTWTFAVWLATRGRKPELGKGPGGSA